MHTEDWILLYHHTASSDGSATPTLRELLTLAKDGNYAQLVDHYFWLLPVLQHEHLHIQQAITDLVGNIKNFLERIPHQSLFITSHQSHTTIDVDPVDDILAEVTHMTYLVFPAMALLSVLDADVLTHQHL